MKWRARAGLGVLGWGGLELEGCARSQEVSCCLFRCSVFPSLSHTLRHTSSENRQQNPALMVSIKVLLGPLAIEVAAAKLIALLLLFVGVAVKRRVTATALIIIIIIIELLEVMGTAAAVGPTQNETEETKRSWPRQYTNRRSTEGSDPECKCRAHNLPRVAEETNTFVVLIYWSREANLAGRRTYRVVRRLVGCF